MCRPARARIVHHLVRIIASEAGRNVRAPHCLPSMRRSPMKRTMAGILAMLAGLLVVPCGGGDGDGKSGASGGGNNAAVAGARAEESAATLSGAWTPASSDLGWSGGSAIQ